MVCNATRMFHTGGPRERRNITARGPADRASQYVRVPSHSVSGRPETPPPTPDASEDVVVGEDDVLPDLVSSAPDTAATVAPPERSPRRSEDERQATRRRPAIHDGRPAVDRARTEKRIAQLRSASQKVFEKRSTQALKRGRLERSNKLREVFSVKGKRPRRQDRLRIQNSGANNNRKC